LLAAVWIYGVTGISVGSGRVIGIRMALGAPASRCSGWWWGSQLTSHSCLGGGRCLCLAAQPAMPKAAVVYGNGPLDPSGRVVLLGACRGAADAVPGLRPPVCDR